MLKRIKPYWQLMRCHQPTGSLLLLWPTLWAVWIASHGQPRVEIIIIFVLGAMLMRAAGCVINDIWDRGFDAHVARTRERPLASNVITLPAALILFFLLLIAALALLIRLNVLSWIIASIAVLLVAAYPLMKRIMPIPQLVLGLAFSCAILMAFAAQRNQLPLLCWLMFFANVLWTIAYDTIYAMSDRDDDKKLGLKSTAILLGKYDRLGIALSQLGFIFLMLIIGWQVQFNYPYYVGLVIAILLMLYQHYLIYYRQPQQCWRAFVNNGSLGGIVFAGIIFAIMLG